MTGLSPAPRSCGAAECAWIDCEDHQWSQGRLCDGEWFAMQLGNLRAKLFAVYAIRAGVPPEDAADIAQNVFFAQSFDGDESCDAAVALAWATLTAVTAPGGSA